MVKTQQLMCLCISKKKFQLRVKSHVLRISLVLLENWLKWIRRGRDGKISPKGNTTTRLLLITNISFNNRVFLCFNTCTLMNTQVIFYEYYRDLNYCQWAEISFLIIIFFNRCDMFISVYLKSSLQHERSIYFFNYRRTDFTTLIMYC